MPKQSLLKLEQYKNEIISSYLSGKSLQKLGVEYNISSQSIVKFLKNKNVLLRTQSQSRRKYALKEDFFDVIDSQEKAYFLGLLYADGCNSTEINCVRIVLTAADKFLLEKLSKLIFIDFKPLYLRKGKLFSDNNKQYIRKDSYCLSINNEHISRTLVSKGLTKAKSFTITFPNWLEDDLIPHFIRGYFDGDGSLSLCKTGQTSVSILGTEQFCKNIKQITLDRLNINSTICHAKLGSDIKQYNLHGNIVCRKFLDWIYKDSTIHLERKYLKYKEILKVIPPPKLEKCNICDSKHYSNGYCEKHHYEFIGKQIRHERYLREGK